MVRYARKVAVFFGAQSEAELIYSLREGYSMQSAARLVDASFSNRVWDWIERILTGEEINVNGR